MTTLDVWFWGSGWVGYTESHLYSTQLLHLGRLSMNMKKWEH
uniref:Uncharacterized protein n=1 Tax=Manihot esculenta TaxID=3983 RepID=A0A2C9U0E7_MANES